MSRTILIASLFVAVAIGLVVFIMMPSPEIAAEKKESSDRAVAKPSAQNIPSSAISARSADKAAVEPELRVGADIVSGTGEQQAAELVAIQDTITEGVVTYSEEGIPVIEPYLTHPNPDVRAAAVDGMVQLGVPSAAAILRKLATKTEDSREKIKLLEAAEFIALPSVPQEVLMRRIKERSQ